MDLKAILNAANDECGFSKPNTYFGSTNDEAAQIVALANRSARVLSKHSWQALRSAHEITMTSAETYPLPDDYRQMIHDTQWVNGRADKPSFPASNEAWAYEVTRGIGGIRYKMRIEGDQFAILHPVAGQVVRFEYISNNPVLAYGGSTSKPRFTADSDTWRLDDDLLIMDIVWRFKKLKGLEDWQVDLEALKVYERTLQGTDQGASTIHTVGGNEWTGEPVADLWVS